MAAELDPPVSGGGRGRRPRRTVITDDSYGDDGYLERDGAEPAPRAPTAPALAKAREAASRTRRQAPSKPAVASPAAPVSNGRVVWRLAAVATLMWLGGVLAFAAGFFQLPLQPLEALPRAAASLPPHLLLMTGAVAIAPLGMIWLTALTARRADALRAETETLAVRFAGGARGGATDMPFARDGVEIAQLFQRDHAIRLSDRDWSYN